MFKKNRHNIFVEPDEIFLDSQNLPQFDTQQFEGRIEKAISKTHIRMIGVVTVLIFCLFAFKIGFLQLKNGQAYAKLSENNSLDHEPLFADRGVVLDRNGVELAWNEKNTVDEPFAIRKYIPDGGFSHVLGYVSYPTKDSSGFYWRDEYLGKDGVEKQYNDVLHGTNGVRIIERDVLGKVLSSNMVNQPTQGTNVSLTIDARMQKTFYTELAHIATTTGYEGGSALVMDIYTGELLTLTNYPEYKSEVLSLGKDQEAIKGYLSDRRKPFLNRALQGLYSPGSIVKPFMAIAALTEGVVNEYTQILSAGSISIPNPYNPKLSSVFKDYAPNNGWVDLRNALKVSSNIYFYEIGGGYHSQKGIGIDKIKSYAESFMIGKKSTIDLPGEKEGVIPDPAWKEKNFNGDPWRIGDTYHTVIGQYGFQVTPIQMLRAVSAIANDGTLLSPHVLAGTKTNEIKLPYNEHYFQVVKEGMHLVATEGTARSLASLPFALAAKTGTAEVGLLKNQINSWMMGFFPYEAPRYAFVIMLEHGPADAGSNVRGVALSTFAKLYQEVPEYFK